ncbi:MAG: hypothetical protein Q4A88_00760 [Clostridia bacterium]|nr:hypothetical protein [Clostridia bacterium]
MQKEIAGNAISFFLRFGSGAPAAKPAATDSAPEGTQANVPEQAEAVAEKAVEPTAAPTEEPTEEPTPAPTAEPEYWKYVLLRDELKESYATTKDAWDRMMEIYDPSTGHWIGFYGPVPDVVWD